MLWRQSINGETLVNLGKRGIKALALLTAAEATVLAAVEVSETLRRRYFWEQPPEEGFPWEEQPELKPKCFLGCGGFLVGAVASLGVPGLSIPSDPTIVKAAYLQGSVFFLVGSYLMLPEMFSD